MVILNLSFSLLARLVLPDTLLAQQFVLYGCVKSGNCVSPDTQTTKEFDLCKPVQLVV